MACHTWLLHEAALKLIHRIVFLQIWLFVIKTKYYSKMGNNCSNQKLNEVTEPSSKTEQKTGEDEASEDEGPEVEEVNETRARRANKELQETTYFHPALMYRKKQHLNSFLKKSMEFEHDRLPELVKVTMSKKMLGDMNINFNIHSENNNSLLGEKEIMELHGLPHVQRHLKPYHPSQLFANRLHQHYLGNGNDENYDNVINQKLKKGINATQFITGFSNLHSEINSKTSTDAVFNMYDLSNNKSYISKSDFLQMTRSLIGSACLANDFRLESIYLGVHHASTKHDDTTECVILEYVNSIFKGKNQLQRKLFSTYVNNPANLAEITHDGSASETINETPIVPASPIVPSRNLAKKVMTKMELPTTSNLNNQNTNHDNNNNPKTRPIVENEEETMEEVMRKLREADVAINAVHHVPNVLEPASNRSEAI